jgi:hypothetical protein
LSNEGVPGETLLAVELALTHKEPKYWELPVEDEKKPNYREWLIPAELINSKARIRIIADE